MCSGHDDISDQRESVAVTHLAQNLDEQVLGANRGEQRQSPVTATGYEVEVALSVAALQSFGQ